LLTLYITPVVYLYMDSAQAAFGPAWRRLARRLRGRHPGRDYEPEQGEGAARAAGRVGAPEV
jgi:hypothetical protein